jgi:hypothetical protein
MVLLFQTGYNPKPFHYGGVVLFVGLSSNHWLCGWYMIAKKRTNADV